jgi:SAM-dependent methyltransferase
MSISSTTSLRIRLLAAALLVLGTAHASEPPTTPGMERVKQDMIYQSKGGDRPEGYIIDRSLLMYSNALGEEFTRSLGALGPGDRWLDIGAGEGRALIDYALSRYDALHGKDGDPGGKGEAVAISIEDRRTQLWHEAVAKLGPGRIAYFFGKPLRDYTLDELGRFQVITDVMGGFSYAEPMSAYMQKTLDLLQVGGSFYGVLLDVHSERGHNPPHYAGAPYRTHIADADGNEVKICAWLKRVGCAQVTCEFRDDWEPPVEIYRVHKTCEQTAVPALLPVHYQAGTPPERGYRLVGDVPANPAPPAVAPAPVGAVRTGAEPR